MNSLWLIGHLFAIEKSCRGLRTMEVLSRRANVCLSPWHGGEVLYEGVPGTTHGCLGRHAHRAFNCHGFASLLGPLMHLLFDLLLQGYRGLRLRSLKLNVAHLLLEESNLLVLQPLFERCVLTAVICL